MSAKKIRSKKKAPVTPRVCTAAEWAAKKGETKVVTLPSAVTVRVKTPDWGKMVLAGQVSVEQLRDVDMNPRNGMATILPLARAMAPHIVVEPVVVENGKKPRENEISVDDIQEGDLLALMLWVSESLTASNALAGVTP